MHFWGGFPDFHPQSLHVFCLVGTLRIHAFWSPLSQRVWPDMALLIKSEVMFERGNESSNMKHSSCNLWFQKEGNLLLCHPVLLLLWVFLFPGEVKIFEDNDRCIFHSFADFRAEVEGLKYETLGMVGASIKSIWDHPTEVFLRSCGHICFKSFSDVVP